MGCMKSTLSERLHKDEEGKIELPTVRTEQTHYVRDPTSNTKHIVSSQMSYRWVNKKDTDLFSLR